MGLFHCYSWAEQLRRAGVAEVIARRVAGCLGGFAGNVVAVRTQLPKRKAPGPSPGLFRYAAVAGPDVITWIVPSKSKVSNLWLLRHSAKPLGSPREGRLLC